MPYSSLVIVGVVYQYGVYLRGLEDLYDEYWNTEEVSVLPNQAAALSAKKVEADVTFAELLPILATKLDKDLKG